LKGSRNKPSEKAQFFLGYPNGKISAQYCLCLSVFSLLFNLLTVIIRAKYQAQ